MNPLPVELKQYADQEEICHGHTNGRCLRGGDRSNTKILVLGDSHAAMLNLFFDTAGEELGITARILTASGCVTIPGFDYQRIADWAQEPCRQQIDFVKKTISIKPRLYCLLPLGADTFKAKTS